HSSDPLLSFYRPPHPRELPSFPTRRSSDLIIGLFHGHQMVAPRLHDRAGRDSHESEQPLSVVGPASRDDQRARHHASLLGHDERSEEHTSELQSPYDLVCRLLLEKKKTKNI